MQAQSLNNRYSGVYPGYVWGKPTINSPPHPCTPEYSEPDINHSPFLCSFHISHASALIDIALLKQHAEHLCG